MWGELPSVPPLAKGKAHYTTTNRANISGDDISSPKCLEDFFPDLLETDFKKIQQPKNQKK